MLQLGKLKQLAFDELSQIFDLEKSDFRLEEYFYEKATNTYKIIVSFLVKNENINTGSLAQLSLGFSKFERIYKEVVIDEEGIVIKFSIYNP
ncbi:hypothetical protein [Chryseobacterium sp. MP_3.2]|uniref:hypothetical protein n=1 Tax=Chryseobacterium sp. MP_3.2 TaxID=3071712 RepID=UPI002E02F1B9|nr:hypothetical protein [Chryseobacterium sp. MP_3.2]